MRKNLNTYKIIFLLLLSVQLFSDQTQEMQEWKKTVISNIKKDPTKNKCPLYERTITTINCNDADYIPKVPIAGKFINHDGLLCQVMHNGVLIAQGCYYEGPSLYWMTDIIYGLKGHHEPQEEKAFYEVLKCIPKGGKMLELGSYWAYYSLWFHKNIPDSENYLIEGNYQNLCIGFRNFQLNGYVGNFFHGYLGTKTDPLIMENSGELIVIDEFLDEHSIDYLDVLSSDIQGAEYAMLLGSKQAMKDHRIHYFFISTHGEALHLKCIELLKEYDYHIVAEHNLSESYSADGLIVARANSIEGIDTIEVSKR
ncbi:MAG: FkbM family methyltransferase [Simkaniaceae bacterium]|nr:MAG: FkbM family methyltransferase [Simkaniaceae bacterium]